MFSQAINDLIIGGGEYLLSCNYRLLLLKQCLHSRSTLNSKFFHFSSKSKFQNSNLKCQIGYSTDYLFMSYNTLP
jgi:hypothetical protein